MEPLQFGRYTLISRVAVGGMAEVYLARDDTPPDGRLVVVKRVLPAFAADPEFRTLFEQEMRIAASLAHRNIVPLHDAGEVDGEPFLTLEYVRGRDLAAVLGSVAGDKESVPAAHATYIASEICEALSFAHERDVVHRDISPANILLSDAGEVKLADFGIARVTDSVPLTRPDARRGKAGYLSPEQSMGRNLDGRSDLFGLGILLWEMLTGQRLFRPDGDRDAIIVMQTQNIEPPSTHNSEVSVTLDKIVLRALERDPDKRYQDAGALGDDLAAHLSKLKPGYRPRDLAKYVKGIAPWKDPRKNERQARGGGTRRLAAPSSPNIADLQPGTLDQTPRGWFGGGAAKTAWGLFAIAVVLAGVAISQQIFVEATPTPTQSPTETVATQTSTATSTPTEARTASPSPTRKPSPTRRRTPKPPLTGSLALRTSPANAKVTVNGTVLQGSSPFFVTNLPVLGGATVVVSAPGFTAETRKFALRSAENAKYEISLKPIAKGTLTVNCLTFYCEVYVDGKLIKATTPLSRHKLTVGEHALTLKNPAYKLNHTRKITVKAGTDTKVIVDAATLIEKE